MPPAPRRGPTDQQVRITEADITAIAAATSRIIHGPPAPETREAAQVRRLTEAARTAPTVALHQLDPEQLTRHAASIWDAVYGSPLGA